MIPWSAELYVDGHISICCSEGAVLPLQLLSATCRLPALPIVTCSMRFTAVWLALIHVTTQAKAYHDSTCMRQNGQQHNSSRVACCGHVFLNTACTFAQPCQACEQQHGTKATCLYALSYTILLACCFAADMALCFALKSSNASNHILPIKSEVYAGTMQPLKKKWLAVATKHCMQ